MPDRKFRLPALIFFLLPAVFALLAILQVISIPTDPKNSLLWGLSASRLVLLGFLLLIAVFFGWVTAMAWRHPDRFQAWIDRRLQKQSSMLLFLASGLLLFVLAYSVFALPPKYLGALQLIHERLSPALFWFAMFGLEIVLGITIWLIKNRARAIGGFPVRKILAVAGTNLAIFLCIWLWVGATKMGVWPGNNYWGKAEAPILWPQFAAILAISLALEILLATKIDSFRKVFWVDLVICIAIWMAAIVIWNNQSFTPGVFTTMARPPAYEIYPSNDSQTYDVAAQNILIGNHDPTSVEDKSLYITVLVILHALAGPSFSAFYLLQIALLAGIPVIGYFLGKQLHTRYLGILFAILLVIREKNVIQLTNVAQVSTVKTILSEPLTTLGVLLCTLCFISGLRQSKPGPGTWQFWLGAGLLGLTGLIRLNILTILPFVLAAILISIHFDIKRWLAISLVITSFVCISILPWSLHNYQEYGDPLTFVRVKTNGVILNNRYVPIITNRATPQAPVPTPGPANQPAQTPNAKTPEPDGQKYLVLGQNIFEHYLHNLIGITIMLPPSGTLYNLDDMVRLPYWKINWDGSLQPDGYFMLFAILGIIAAGIGAAWIYRGMAGIVPLLIILGYNVSTALALTSGTRYLVPIDWGPLLYFSLGIAEISIWLFSLFGWALKSASSQNATAQPGTTSKTPYRLLGATVLLCLAIGSTPVIVNTFIPPLFPPVSTDDFLTAFQNMPTAFTPEQQGEIKKILENPLAKIAHGRALYPRFYPPQQGDTWTNDSGYSQDPLTATHGFPRLTFYLMGNPNIPVMLRGTVLEGWSNGETVWVLGCDRLTYIEALVVFVEKGKETHIYQPDPPKSTCP